MLVGPAVVTTGVNTPSQLSRPVNIWLSHSRVAARRGPLTAVVEITGASCILSPGVSNRYRCSSIAAGIGIVGCPGLGVSTTVLVGPSVVTTGVNTPSQLSRPVNIGAVTVGLQPGERPLTAVVEITGVRVS